MQTNRGIKLGIVLPYSIMQIPPAADNPNDKTRAILIPVTLYHKPPKTAPNISDRADANAFVKMFPGKNLSVKLN
jgi:hypothetical protein